MKFSLAPNYLAIWCMFVSKTANLVLFSTFSLIENDKISFVKPKFNENSVLNSEERIMKNYY